MHSIASIVQGRRRRNRHKVFDGVVELDEAQTASSLHFPKAIRKPVAVVVAEDDTDKDIEYYTRISGEQIEQVETVRRRELGSWL